MKICINCKWAGYTGALYGLAEEKKTTVKTLEAIYCFSDRNYYKKNYSCDKFEERADKLFE